MSIMKTIEITVSPRGDAVVQTQGFSGASCREASRFVERALGVVQSDTPTPEMYHAAATEQNVEQRQ